MELDTILEVTEKLIGHTESIADENYDDYSNKNIEIKFGVMHELLNDLMKIAEEKDSQYYSVSRNAKHSLKLLKNLYEELDDFIKKYIKEK